jgi:hypothetical protein
MSNCNRLSAVVTATTVGDEYDAFTHLFCRAWRKFYPGVDIYVLRVGEGQYRVTRTENDLIFVDFPAPPGVSSAFVSQVLRLLYPALISGDGYVLITDIDMIPLSGRFFSDVISRAPHNSFVCFRDALSRSEEIPICFNAGSPAVWRDIFQVFSPEDCRSKLKSVFASVSYSGRHSGRGWSTDQRLLYAELSRWERLGNKVNRLTDAVTGYVRLDRSALPPFSDDFVLTLSGGHYTDFHAIRPQSAFSNVNDFILQVAAGGLSRLSQSEIDLLVDSYRLARFSGGKRGLFASINDTFFEICGRILPRRRRSEILSKLSSFVDHCKRISGFKR